MREFGINIDDALINGLLPDARAQRNLPYMQTMQNARPTPFGAVSPERISYPCDADYPTVDWPFPQLLRDERVILEAGATSLSTVSSAWAKTSVTTYDPDTPANTKAIVQGGLWNLAAFRDLYFLTNGSSFVWKVPSNTSDKTFVRTDITVKALCRHNGRLILAGCAGSWFAASRFTGILDAWRETSGQDVFTHEDVAIDTGFVFWCEQAGGANDLPFHVFLCMMGMYGDSAFDKVQEMILTHLEQGKIGIAWIPTPGDVKAVKGLGERILVYGDNGISSLNPSGNGYQEGNLIEIGIPGRGAVAGAPQEHLFVDNAEQVWRFPAGAAAPQKLGYDQYIKAIEVFIRAFGSYGSGSGELAPPNWVAVEDNAVLVSDNGNDQVQRFSRTGVWDSDFITDVTGPTAIAVYEDEIYVVDNANSRVRVYSASTGAYQRQFGAYGTGDGQWIGCFGIACYDDEVFVCDAGNDRVVVFSTAGVFDRTFGSNGTGNGQLVYPSGISVTKCGKVLVCDEGNHRIQQFTTAGTYVRKWGSYGTANGEFACPTGIVFIDEEVFVTDSDNDRLQVFDIEGTFIRKHGVYGTGDGDLNGPQALWIDDGRAYVADTGNARIQVLDIDFIVSLLISYDPGDDEYWLATNIASYVLTRTGLGGPMSAIPTALWRDDLDKLVGSGDNLDDDALVMLLRTQVLDFAERGTKQLNTVQMACRNLKDMRARMHIQYALQDCVANSGWTPFSPEGVAFPVLSFSDGALSVKGTVEKRDARVERIELRYQPEDRRFVRGTKPGEQR